MRAPWLVGLLILLGAVLAGCEDSTGPSLRKPPYLAIVTDISAPSASEVGTQYTYRVQELSGTLKIDTLITVNPTDTVIVSLPPATYVVTLEGVPGACQIREGTQQAVYIAAGSNTSLLRYLIQCEAQLTLVTSTDGPENDSTFLYAVYLADGSRRLGLVGLHDTVRLNDLPPGPATIHLAQASSNCIITSDGGIVRQLTIDSVGRQQLDFRVLCSVVAQRPAILSLVADYHDGAAGMVLRASDPDRDLDGYSWDITDCHRHSILPRGVRTRPGLGGSLYINPDTVLVVAALEAGLPDSIQRSACAAVWVYDAHGNTSAIHEVRFGTGPGSAPRPVAFNAILNGTQRLLIQLSAQDADGDFLGSFATAAFRDGTFGTGDGRPDLALFNVQGYLGTAIPDLYFSQLGVSYQDITSQIVYLFDAAGHFTRLEDPDLFQ